MIFNVIVTLWILYTLKAPLWCFILSCIGAICIYYRNYEVDTKFTKLADIAGDIKDILTDCKERVKKNE